MFFQLVVFQADNGGHMYQLYIANKNYSSWSLRPWFLLKTKNITFAEHIVQFIDSDNWNRFRQFAPNGRVPCLHDGDTVVWDSLAITEYVAEQHPGVWPSDHAARTYARCAVAEMHSGFSSLRGQCPMHVAYRIKMHQINAALQRDIDRLNELWQLGLQRFGGPYLAGDTLSAVDAFFAPVAFRYQTYGLPFASESVAYLNRLLALPAMQEWQSAALKETWRDEIHDIESQKAGELIKDLRQQ
jgi:glutathione S-transferase